VPSSATEPKRGTSLIYQVYCDGLPSSLSRVSHATPHARGRLDSFSKEHAGACICIHRTQYYTRLYRVLGLFVKEFLGNLVMDQLRVGHWVYRIEGQYLENPLFPGQNGVSLSTRQVSAKMVRCRGFSKNMPGLYLHMMFFSSFPNLTALFGVACPLRLKYKRHNLI